MTIYRHAPTERGDPCPWLLTLPAEDRGNADWQQCIGGWTETCEARCQRRRSEQRMRQAEARRSAKVRAFPFPPGPNRMGACNWCKDPITTSRAKSRSWHNGREAEPDCLYAYYLHSRPEVQKAFLLRRDGIGCCECGVVAGRWFMWWTMRGEWRDRHDPDAYERQYPRAVFVGDADIISWSTDLHLEHTIPLWSVVHLPDDERAAYFGPENLKLMCIKCHAAKTKLEAGQRAAARA